MKKFLSLLMVLCVLLSTASLAFAETVEIPDPQTQPRWVVSCPSGGKHQMSPRGGGYIYSGSPSSPGTRLYYGYFNQCKSCQEAMWSQYQPMNTHKLGYYKVLGVKDMIPITGTNAYLNGSSLDYFGGNVLQDSYWQGYTFLTSSISE